MADDEEMAAFAESLVADTAPGQEPVLDCCPCCEGEARKRVTVSFGVALTTIHCSVCGLQTQPHSSESRCIANWNRRA